MKLLIITQVVDLNHPNAGFMHHWIEVFANHFEHIHVIALEVGEYRLPKNVQIHSLGKERGASLFQKLYSFFSCVYRLRREYDAVFVHQNPEYVVLAGWWWRMAGKTVGLWYNHTVGSVWLKIGRLCTNHLFYTSPYAATARYTNAVRMPAGIDTNVFAPGVLKIPRSVYMQGRVAPAKRVHIALEAFALLHSKGLANRLTIVGPEVASYVQPLRGRYRELVESGALVFRGPVQNEQTPVLFAAHEVAINLTDDGNYDKSILEAMACGTPVVVGSRAFADLVPDTWIVPERTPERVAEKIQELFAFTPAERQALGGRLRDAVKKHSLTALVEHLVRVYQTS